MIGLFAWGPRPGQPNNVNFCDEYDVMEDPAERARRRQSWIDRGYGSVAAGPIYCPAYFDGTRKWAPDTDWVWANPITTFYARMDELFAAGFKVSYFAIPDAGPFVRPDGGPDLMACEKHLGPIYRSPEFQSRFNTPDSDIVEGWEPDWLSADHVAACTWLRSIFTRARIWIHLQPGHAAPGLSSEESDTFTTGMMWQRVAPYVNGYKMQASRFLDIGWQNLDKPWPYPVWENGADTTPRQDFLYDVWDNGRRLKQGYAGWPTIGHGGLPFLLDVFEYASYWVSRALCPEAVAVQLGRDALAHPPFWHPGAERWIDVRGLADRIGDGCPVPRPDRAPVPV